MPSFSTSEDRHGNRLTINQGTDYCLRAQWSRETLAVERVEGRECTATVRSCLGNSLMRIHKGLEQTQHQEEQVENLFRSWQEKWSTRREQISRRLELIEAQLDSLARKQDHSPRLSIVRAPYEADDMTATRPF